MVKRLLFNSTHMVPLIRSFINLMQTNCGCVLIGKQMSKPEEPKASPKESKQFRVSGKGENPPVVKFILRFLVHTWDCMWTTVLGSGVGSKLAKMKWKRRRALKEEIASLIHMFKTLKVWCDCSLRLKPQLPFILRTTGHWVLAHVLMSSL